MSAHADHVHDRAHRAAAPHWECPCGQEQPTRAGAPTPVRTMVSLREPRCRSCGSPFKEEYRRPAGGRTA